MLPVNTTTRNTIYQKFGGEWRTECLSTRFPMPLLSKGEAVNILTLTIYPNVRNIFII